MSGRLADSTPLTLQAQRLEDVPAVTQRQNSTFREDFSQLCNRDQIFTVQTAHERPWRTHRSSTSTGSLMERDMTLRPKIRATSSQTNNEKNTRDRIRVPGCTFAPRQQRLSHRDNPNSHTPQQRLTTKPVPCTTSPGTRQLFNPWSKYGRNCSDDSFLETLSGFRSHQSSRFSSI